MNKEDAKIVINHIGFKTKQGQWLYKDLNASLDQKRVGLIGKNGSGKSTLMRIIVDEIEPESGRVVSQPKIAYLPQDFEIKMKGNVKDALGISERLGALERIAKGKKSKDDLLLAENNWDVLDRAERALKRAGLDPNFINKKTKELSGGERTKLMLASLLVDEPDYLIIDEPTNHLDLKSKEFVYELLRNWNKGALVVSHDRTLLNIMDQIIELEDGDLHKYGGNYDFYKSIKDTENSALERKLGRAKDDLRRVRLKKTQTIERMNKKHKLGKEKALDRSQSRMEVGKMKQTAAKTNARTRNIHIELAMGAEERLKNAMENMPEVTELNIDLSRGALEAGRVVLTISNLTYCWGENEPLFKNFNLEIYGPERIAIEGPNGAGKTTLLKLIIGKLKPNDGIINLGINKSTYLDQHVRVLKKDKTLLDNMSTRYKVKSNALASAWLAKWLFRGPDMHKLCGVLSGGELMRASLAYVLAGDNLPELLILDEPVNNLDITTVNQIESALRSYRGALIVVSHDKHFLSNIDITKTIKL